MRINKITMKKEKAKRLWREYCKVLRTREKDYQKEIKEIKACYYQLSKGRPIINIIDVFKKFGFNESFQPILAFSLAKERFIYFRQSDYQAPRGSADFTNGDDWNQKIFLHLPNDTFHKIRRNRSICLKTAVPIIPPKFLPKTLRGCYLLWEVEDWEKHIPRRDPILLKRIYGNLFAIMSGWSLTKVESMIIKGRV